MKNIIGTAIATADCLVIIITIYFAMATNNKSLGLWARNRGVSKYYHEGN